MILGRDFASGHSTIPLLEKIFGFDLKTSRMLLVEEEERKEREKREKGERGEIGKRRRSGDWRLESGEGRVEIGERR